MVLPTTFSTMPNSVIGSTCLRRSWNLERSSILFIKQGSADCVDLAADAAVKMCLSGIDDEVAALQRGIVFNSDCGIDVCDCNADTAEILPADAESDRLMARNTLQRDRSQSSHQIGIYCQLALHN